MGYSARYHAASLAAVFLALAIGILIGAGLGDSIVSDTEESLRESLEGDIEEARGEAEDLSEELERERAFTARAYPALVGDTLRGRRIGVLALADLPQEVGGDVEAALEPTGADLVEVSVVRLPPDDSTLASELDPGPFAAVDREGNRLEELGRQLGSQFVRGGGKLLGQVRDTLFSRSSGEGGRLRGIVLVQGPLGELEPPEDRSTEHLSSGLVSGVADSGVTAVAVERTDAPSSSVPFFSGLGLPTVDDLDLTAGRVAMVFALLGAKGNFGVKETAQSLLPELLVRTRSPR